MRKSQGNVHCTTPLLIPPSWEAVCQSSLTVCQSNPFTTILRTSDFMQVSPFSSTVTRGLFSSYAFLKFGNISFSLETFCRCVINRRGHAFPRTQNIFTNGALIPKSYSALSSVALMFSLGNFGATSSALCLSQRCGALLRTNLHISVFLSKVASVRSCTKASVTLGKNWKSRVCCCFHEWQNPELWEAMHISGTPHWVLWFLRKNTVQP